MLPQHQAAVHHGAALITAFADAALVLLFAGLQEHDYPDPKLPNWWEANVLNYTFTTSVFDIAILTLIRVFLFICFSLSVRYLGHPTLLLGFLLFSSSFSLTKAAVMTRLHGVGWASLAVAYVSSAMSLVEIALLMMRRSAEAKAEEEGLLAGGHSGMFEDGDGAEKQPVSGSRAFYTGSRTESSFGGSSTANQSGGHININAD